MGRAFEYRKEAKLKRWGRLSRTFPKLARAITAAAKQGGSIDPDQNVRLRVAIQNAKAENMPKENIERAIQRVSKGESEDQKEYIFEIKGPHGVFMIVECSSDNYNRSLSFMKTATKKFNGELAPAGALDHLFTRKTICEFLFEEDMDLEDMELSLIDHGLKTLERIGENVIVTADYHDFGLIHQGLLEAGVKMTRSMLTRVPRFEVDLEPRQEDEANKMIRFLEEYDDVDWVFTNLAN